MRNVKQNPDHLQLIQRSEKRRKEKARIKEQHSMTP